MNKLVVHQTYINGMAFDTSNNRNHGIPYSVTQAPAPYAPSFWFQVPDSRVVVQPSPSLQDLIAVRAIVTFYLSPPSGIVQRYNLIEGHLAFAMYVESDGSLMGTILDSKGNWLGAQSSPNLVTVNQWHQAEIRHDGINQCTILLDGQTVATSYSAQGPVSSVGPYGIAIGHWPDSPGVYTFQGYIREIWVYKYDPVEAAKSLLDPCCIDRKALDRMADRLRAQGYTADKAHQQAMEILNFSLRVVTEVRGNDSVVSQQQASISARALAAFLQGDSATYTTTLAQLAALASSRLSAAQMTQIHSDEDKLMNELPLPLGDWQALIASLCWDRSKLDPCQLVSDYKRFGEQYHKYKKK